VTTNGNGNGAKMRSFEDRPAVREQVPLMIGLMGPSGGGKTFSALRLATGIQRVSGGEIFVIDTEARRALHYASRFKFRHVAFGAPFGPLDYLAAIEHCVRKGAKVVIVDSMSHEHEGPGGVLEMHEAEVQKLSGGNAEKAERVKMLAWSKPKAARRRMINSILQQPCNFIFCFRAKEKIKVERGKPPEPRGFMPIAGEEFVYEMTLNALLLPNAGGVPTWQSNEIGEKQMIKLPEQFRTLLLGAKGPLTEDIGQELATWAAGDESALPADADPEDYVIPVTFNKKHGGNPLRRYDNDQLAYFANNDKAPPALRASAKRALAARTAPEPGASDEPDPADDDVDFDPDTGEVHEPGDDQESGVAVDDATA
jgi:energy-coupling factor transporter ATP-binding protein EcfA2